MDRDMQDTFEYIVFVLGYDLLQEHFSKSDEPECDLVYDKCTEIAGEFMESEQCKDYSKSLYDCLRDFIREKGLLKEQSEEMELEETII